MKNSEKYIREFIFNAFLLDDKGYRHAVPVTIREVIDGYAIVTNGLNEGEQVTLN